LAKRARAYRGEKRSKELARQKKQEEKRLRRHSKRVNGQPETEEIDSEDKDAGQQN
jgi:hypothetical protein